VPLIDKARFLREAQWCFSNNPEMESGRTIVELKSAFIWTQVRILSESLDLPEDWRNYATETEEGDLNPKVIEDVLHKCQSTNRNPPWPLLGFNPISLGCSWG
jgi:hypothetical protein